MNTATDSVLATLDKCRVMITRCTTAREAMSIANAAEAAAIFSKREKMSEEISNRAVAYRLRAIRKLGEILAGSQKAKGGWTAKKKSRSCGSKEEPQDAPTLAELGLNKKLSAAAQALAKVPEAKFEKTLEAEAAAGAIKVSQFVSKANSTAHVSNNSGENEWYTPAEFIEAARAVMGTIDLDPASTSTANKVVKARRFFTKEQDGLNKKWRGNLWMNPPYEGALIKLFMEKICQSHESKEISAAIVLVNNATETHWFQETARRATAICFPKSRVKFWSPGRIAAPLQGQAVILVGGDALKFAEVFGKFGFVLARQ